MPFISDKPIDESSDASLRAAFTKACVLHGFSPDGEDGSDLATVLSHAFMGPTAPWRHSVNAVVSLEINALRMPFCV